MVDDSPEAIEGIKSALVDMATVDVRIPNDVTKTHLADADSRHAGRGICVTISSFQIVHLSCSTGAPFLLVQCTR
jgi:hypothetical protein